MAVDIRLCDTAAEGDLHSRGWEGAVAAAAAGEAGSQCRNQGQAPERDAAVDEGGELPWDTVAEVGPYQSRAEAQVRVAVYKGGELLADIAVEVHHHILPLRPAAGSL